jgi:hypothetical protein
MITCLHPDSQWSLRKQLLHDFFLLTGWSRASDSWSYPEISPFHYPLQPPLVKREHISTCWCSTERWALTPPPGLVDNPLCTSLLISLKLFFTIALLQVTKTNSMSKYAPLFKHQHDRRLSLAILDLRGSYKQRECICPIYNKHLGNNSSIKINWSTKDFFPFYVLFFNDQI